MSRPYREDQPEALFGLIGLVPDEQLADAVGTTSPRVNGRRRKLGIPSHKQRQLAARSVIAALERWDKAQGEYSEVKDYVAVAHSILGAMPLEDFKVLVHGISKARLIEIVALRRRQAKKQRRAKRKGPKANAKGPSLGGPEGKALKSNQVARPSGGLSTNEIEGEQQ